MRQMTELVVTGDEVAFAVQLQEDAQLVVVVDVGGDDALPRRAGRFRASLGHAFLAQPVLGFLEIAVGRLEGALGVHHSRAGGVAQCLDLVCRNGHGYFSSSRASSS